jgi:hypothetical protein
VSEKGVYCRRAALLFETKVSVANKLKALEKYLVPAPTVHTTSLEAYSACPAEAFLAGVCDAHDAFAHCLNKFTKKQDGTYNKDSKNSLRQISLALVGALMGHFETFQKAVFAGMVERSPAFPGFSVDSFILQIEKNGGSDVVISPGRLLAFRSVKAPVGFVVADSLKGWHKPAGFNSMLRAFGIKKDYFGGKEISDLEVLWQLRHTIVHTGAWLTEPDAQKVKRLSKFGNGAIVFDPKFINAVSRRLHRIIKAGNTRIEVEAVNLLGPSPPASVVKEFQSFFAVRSPKKVWLK